MCAARKIGRAWKQRANLKKHVTGKPFTRTGIFTSGPCHVTDGKKFILFVLDYFTKW